MTQSTAQFITEMMAGYEARLKRVDDAYDFAMSTGDNWPAINLLRNSAAQERDTEGNYISPIAVYFTAGHTATATIEVLEWVDETLPQVVADAAVNKMDGATIVTRRSFNVIKVTYSANGTQNQPMIGLANVLKCGLSTCGARYVYTEGQDVYVNGHKIEPGVLTENVFLTSTPFANFDGMKIVSTDDDQVVYIIDPFVAAGRITVPPLTLFDRVSPASYYFGNQYT